MKMQDQILHDDDCATFLVEAIAKDSQNIKWEPTVNGQKIGHKLIRRVSMDKFYGLVTGEPDAFYQLCMILPEIIEKVIENSDDIAAPKDKVILELAEIVDTKDISYELAIYLLGFGKYNGFSNL